MLTVIVSEALDWHYARVYLVCNDTLLHRVMRLTSCWCIIFPLGLRWPWSSVVHDKRIIYAAGMNITAIITTARMSDTIDIKAVKGMFYAYPFQLKFVV